MLTYADACVLAAADSKVTQRASSAFSDTFAYVPHMYAYVIAYVSGAYLHTSAYDGVTAYVRKHTCVTGRPEGRGYHKYCIVL